MNVAVLILHNVMYFILTLMDNRILTSPPPPHDRRFWSGSWRLTLFNERDTVVFISSIECSLAIFFSKLEKQYIFFWSERSGRQADRHIILGSFFFPFFLMHQTWFNWLALKSYNNLWWRIFHGLTTFWFTKNCFEVDSNSLSLLKKKKYYLPLFSCLKIFSVLRFLDTTLVQASCGFCSSRMPHLLFVARTRIHQDWIKLDNHSKVLLFTARNHQICWIKRYWVAFRL